MSLSPGDTIKSIEVALNNESRERDFYLMHGKRTTNNMGKLMFTTLAQDEIEHYQRLLKLHETLSAQDTWPETVPLTVNGSNLHNVLKGFLNKVESASPADVDDHEAVKIAIDFEQKAYLFYSSLKNAVGNQQEKKFFTMLADMELEHYHSLKDTLLYFEDPSGWFLMKEKTNVDG